ncbi:MAG: hypothetical protein WAM60_04480 [Candidatus Promineifilaceae bacterium]
MSKQVKQFYQSFLIRCWLTTPYETTAESPSWRFELQEVSAESEKHRFSNLEQVNAFIATRLTAVSNNSMEEDDKQES